MDFLRRVLGLPDNSSVPSEKEDGIIITHEDTAPSAPPEPVVEVPVQSKAGVEVEAVQVVAPDTPLVPPDEKNDLAELGTRPLPPLETVIPKPGERLQFGQLSDVGMQRGNNQDAMMGIVATSTSNDDVPDFGLFVVADGMGGHQEGERASSITVRIVTQYVLNQILTSMLRLEMNDPDQPSISDTLRAAVQEANDAVTEAIPEGGTTVTAAVIVGDLAYIAHVGDSRAYLITDEGIEQVTRDHTLVQRLIELDQLTPEEVPDHPQRNVLYRAIGQSDSLDVDAITRRLHPRSRLLLCSDGLWNMVSEDVILGTVSQHSDPQTACNTLVQMANDRGGPDNITVILVYVPG
ncbi:MAG: Stp1/IreP family PP2C-type Ser/Thr phosphatase [Anaerolineae bacterium]|nr:Stp1/IreP family PP2C-type Ser/Thr phosphatase [Anaerolineae bacterium]